jgi:hypothetical protein
MPLSDQVIDELGKGAVWSFRDWPNRDVPTFGAGVYTIWHRDGRFIYVGMSGRGISADTPRRNRPHGLYTRLRSHANGQRSGDQFCVYVADRFVLPTLTQEDIAAIAAGRHQMDALVRRYILMRRSRLTLSATICRLLRRTAPCIPNTSCWRSRSMAGPSD